MSNKELEIFELCERLAELLGDKEAIADLKKLYINHPEMFKNMQDVFNTIKEVVSEPQLIIKNPRPKSEKDYIAVKKLNEEKMGDVGIRNDKGTNIIFHVNLSSNRNFKRLAKKEVVTGEAVHSLHTSRPAELGGNNQKLSGANAHSVTTNNSIKQMLVEASSAKAAPTWSDRYADKSFNDLSRCNKALSTSAKDSISQNKDENQTMLKEVKQKNEDFTKLSIEERIKFLQENQKEIANIKKVSEILDNENKSLQNNQEQPTNDIKSIRRKRK
ncbi:hypothetical protein [Helicobacter sp. MIT 14-3879]|uniref:hypothetical protein n=1 Tax=Helicobacter sp. MIT 14-3879 TaxID=2040649 RepID=UPI002162B9B8|nr:hypothetical protein [Helicobacter sp. MIT 14-3879]